MKITPTLALTILATCLTGNVLAATTESMKDAPNGEAVTLSGTVEDFSSQHSFTLRDASGTVTVDLTSAKPMVLKEGETVEVSGTVNRTILGTDLVAGDITEKKGIGEQVGSAIDSITGQDAEGSARSVTISALPKTGLVKVSGVVTSVDSGKKFTLKDSTGHVEVAIKSGESASLDKGTEVMVVGNVDHGFLGTRINATKVDVLSSGTPVAEQ